DGTADATSQMSGSFSFGTSPGIGYDSENSQNNFLGLIDEVSVYNRGLVIGEIRYVFNAGSAGKCFSQSAPAIILPPTDQTVTLGNQANFAVVAAGSGVLTFQWRQNGTNLAGATNSTLMIANAQSTNAGAYTVVVANASGSTTSSSGRLTVNPALCTPAPAGLLGLWRGDGNAGDLVAGNDGTLNGQAAYGPGKVGQAFTFSQIGDGVSLNNAANFQLQSFSIEAWIKRGDLSKASLSGGAGSVFGYGTGGYTFGLLDAGQMFLSRVDDTAVNSTIQITDQNWH